MRRYDRHRPEKFEHVTLGVAHFGKATHRLERVLRKRKLANARHGVQQQTHQPKRSIDFFPFHHRRGETPETKAINRAKRTVAPDVKRIVEHVRLFQTFEMRLRLLRSRHDGISFFQMRV